MHTPHPKQFQTNVAAAFTRPLPLCLLGILSQRFRVGLGSGQTHVPQTHRSPDPRRPMTHEFLCFSKPTCPRTQGFLIFSKPTCPRHRGFRDPPCPRHIGPVNPWDTCPMGFWISQTQHKPTCPKRIAADQLQFMKSLEKEAERERAEADSS